MCRRHDTTVSTFCKMGGHQLCKSIRAPLGRHLICLTLRINLQQSDRYGENTKVIHPDGLRLQKHCPVEWLKCVGVSGHLEIVNKLIFFPSINCQLKGSPTEDDRAPELRRCLVRNKLRLSAVCILIGYKSG